MKIQVRINEEGALRNQRHAFSNRFTLVSELLQNARRAGARLIRIDHDPQAQILTVQDDGHGLDDFQKLLSFHESGWDADTCTQERPSASGSRSACTPPRAAWWPRAGAASTSTPRRTGQGTRRGRGVCRR